MASTTLARKAQPKEPHKVASGFLGASATYAKQNGLSVEQVRADWLERAQIARVEAAQRNERETAAQTQSVHTLITSAPVAADTLVALMKSRKTPAAVRRLCAVDILTFSGVQKAAEKRMESSTKDVSEMTVDELNTVIGSLTKARDEMEAAPVGEIVATDPT